MAVLGATATLDHRVNSDMIELLRRKVSDFRRARARRLGSPLGLGRSAVGTRRILLATDDNSILKSQIDPFCRYASQILDRFGVVMHEVEFARVVEMVNGPHRGIDTVVLQPWFTVEPARLVDTVDTVRRAGVRRIVFLDGYAPTDLRFASSLEGKIDLYVKKHVLKDRTRYGKATRGDTNLVDYYSRLYGIETEEVLFPVGGDFLSKLVVGPSFFTQDALWGKLLAGPRSGVRDIDVHARLGVGEDWGWYSRMRRASVASLDPLQGRVVLTGAGVSHAAYMRELDRSKVCFSPFGFGEMAWRDYEAIVSGCVLVKPDCGHLDLEPDIFRPDETYVSVRWDFADVADKVEALLRDEPRRQRIAAEARQRLLAYVDRGGFMDTVAAMFDV